MKDLRKYYYAFLPILLALIFALDVSADNGNRSRPLETKRSENGQKIRETMEDKKEKIKYKLEEKKDKIRDRLATISQRFEERKEKLERKSKDRIEHFWKKMERRFEAALDREAKLIERIQARIDKFKAEGKHISVAQTQLDKAKQDLDSARVKFATLKQKVMNALSADDPKEAFKEVRVLSDEFIQILKSVHRSVVKTLGILKGMSRPKISVSPTASPSSSVSPSTSPSFLVSPIVNSSPTTSPSPSPTP